MRALPRLIGLATAIALLGAADAPSRVQASSLDRQVIRRVIRKQVRAIYTCWAREAARGTPLGRGRAVVELEIATSGRVTRAAFTVDPVRSDPVTRCIVAVFLSMRFPTYTETGPVLVRYPLWFDPDGSNDE